MDLLGRHSNHTRWAELLAKGLMHPGHPARDPRSCLISELKALPPATVAALAAAYRAGASINEPAARYGVHRTPVTAQLDRSTVPRRPRGPTSPVPAPTEPANVRCPFGIDIPPTASPPPQQSAPTAAAVTPDLSLMIASMDGETVRNLLAGPLQQTHTRDGGDWMTTRAVSPPISTRGRSLARIGERLHVDPGPVNIAAWSATGPDTGRG